MAPVDVVEGSSEADAWSSSSACSCRARIRRGEPLNEGLQVARSTLTAILGRIATYTGQTVTWEQALASQEDLCPRALEFGPPAVPPVAMPGRTRLS